MASNTTADMCFADFSRPFHGLGTQKHDVILTMNPSAIVIVPPRGLGYRGTRQRSIQKHDLPNEDEGRERYKSKTVNILSKLLGRARNR